MITTITQQTNLLALNATIEAVRAGESGRGFAVVANEVKDLARETASSAEDITHKVEAIQLSSQEAITAITEVSQIIHQVNDISHAVATSIKEQSAMTNEIAQNITEATEGSKDSTTAISGVATVTQNSLQQAKEVQDAAEGLVELAEQLQQLITGLKM